MLSSIRTCYDDGDCQDMKGGEGSTHVVRKHERMVRFSEEERRARDIHVPFSMEVKRAKIHWK